MNQANQSQTHRIIVNQTRGTITKASDTITMTHRTTGINRNRRNQIENLKGMPIKWKRTKTFDLLRISVAMLKLCLRQFSDTVKKKTIKILKMHEI